MLHFSFLMAQHGGGMSCAATATGLFACCFRSLGSLQKSYAEELRIVYNARIYMSTACLVSITPLQPPCSP